MIARARAMRLQAQAMRATCREQNAACREQKARARNALFALRLKRRVEARLAKRGGQ